MCRFELNMPPCSERRRCDSVEVGTFLSVATAEFVSYLRSPGLPQEDLDEESVFGVGWDHDLLDVRVCWALIAADRRWENSQCDFLYSRVRKKSLSTHRSWTGGSTARQHKLRSQWTCWDGWVVVVLGAEALSPDGHVSVLGLPWLGTALQWCLGDSWHGLVHQHLLVLHSLTWARCITQFITLLAWPSPDTTCSFMMRLFSLNSL